MEFFNIECDTVDIKDTSKVFEILVRTKKKYYFILIDLSDSKMESLSFLHSLKTMEFPKVFIVGLIDSGEKYMNHKELGIDDIIQKPFSEEKFLEAIKKYNY